LKTIIEREVSMPIYKKKRPSRPPSHPGAVLKELWLKELGISQSDFAKRLSQISPTGVSKSAMLTKLNEVVNGRRAMSAKFSVLVGLLLETSPRMWLGLQMNYDLWKAQEDLEVA
jgi:addiction module HigA family antidote